MMTNDTYGTVFKAVTEAVHEEGHVAVADQAVGAVYEAIDGAVDVGVAAAVVVPVYVAVHSTVRRQLSYDQ